jgi:hypothetical protein
MKTNIVIQLTAAAVVCAVSSSLSAGTIIYEPFDYTSGDPVIGQVNSYSSQSVTWNRTGTAATSGAVHSVGSPGLTSPPGFPSATGNMADLANNDNTEMARLNIPDAFNPDLTPKYGASSSLYYSLLVDVPSITGLTTAHSNLNANNDLIIGFNNVQGAQAGRPNAWSGELVIRLGSTAGTYNLGIRASTTTASTTYFTGDLTPGDTHLVVVQTSLGANPGTAANDLNSIWLDPNSSTFGLGEGSRPAPDGSSNGANSATDAQVSLQSIIIGSGIAVGANPNHVYVDEIRVGNTWADVTSQVPEPASFSLIGLIALSLASCRCRRIV